MDMILDNSNDFQNHVLAKMLIGDYFLPLIVSISTHFKSKFCDFKDQRLWD